MNVYTNSNQVWELITSQTHVDVEPFDNHVPESKEVNLFLLDDHLMQSNYQQEEKVSTRNHVAATQTRLGRNDTADGEIQ